MIDTKELENKIFACILLDAKILEDINLDEKYFKYKNVLIYFKNLYKKYKYLDTELIVKKNNNINQK